MRIVFVSNYYNHHQSSLSMSLYNELHGDYFFICTNHISEERISLGYKVLSAPFVLNFDENKEKCKYVINSADAVVIGSAPYELVEDRLKNGKLVFFYSERLFKSGDIKTFGLLLRRIKYHFRYNRFHNAYLLCASAFAKYDYSKLHSFSDKAFEWGYFPETRVYEVNSLLDSKDPRKILWVGRLIDWKHPEVVLIVAKMLKDEGYSFSIDIVGSGVMEQSLRQIVVDYNLDECVNLVGSIPTNMVRDYMEKSGIYLFTSDRNEGWGAVLNESMNSACAVVASDAIGAVPFLLKNKENGLIYHCGDTNRLYHLVKSLLDDDSLQRKLGSAAYRSIINNWNANNAAKRLVSLSSYLNNKSSNDYPYIDGPCSYAPVIEDDWYIMSEDSL